ncbi:hypothetical protein EGW08_019632 [Elysia chlorotica]|uniref:G-protein coupled receptors family 1 profile domain-containing protein n=1 Tax=Elysia chlorotica TaxID=188477 RepID=A0A3S0ZDN1_ELYCH|nr:hypothetical protein EGW08_019632 [Elysia chlorotica]
MSTSAATIIDTINIDTTIIDTINITATKKPSGFLSLEEFVLSTAVIGSLAGFLNLCGLVSNLVNMRTFIRMGVTKDPMTLAFFLLSISDMGVSCSSLVMWVSLYVYCFEMTEMFKFFRYAPTSANRNGPVVYSEVDPIGVSIFAFNVITVFNVTTVLITVYLAVVRFLCVARPLHFRSIISTRRTLAAILFFFLLSIMTRIPVLAHMGMPVTFDPVFKVYRPALWLHPNRENIKNIMWTIFDMGLTTGAQVVLSVCVVLMARKLRAANEFRNSASVASKPGVGDDSVSSTPTPNLNNKDARIIQQLVLISSIFIVCNIPRLTRNFSTLIAPEFDIGGRYQPLYYVTGSVTNVFDAVNSSVNVFVYYTYNSKFRQLCSFF